MDADSANPKEIEQAPPNPVRWFRPFISTAHLELLTTPVLAQSAESDKWVALSEAESQECERIWQTLTEEEKAAAIKHGTTIPGSAGDDKNKDAEVEAEVLPSATPDEVGVAIGKEKLFEIDVRHLLFVPIYWKANGPPLKVRRVTWMYDEYHPVSEELAFELDEAYKHVQPWRHAYPDELDTALSHGVEGYEKIKYTFYPAGTTTPTFILFEDEGMARVISSSATARLSLNLLTAFRRPLSKHPLPLGTFVYRGYERTLRQTNPGRLTPPPTAQIEKETEPAILDEAQPSIKSDGRRGSPTTGLGDDESHEITDLVLMIHGIGQGMAANWEAFNFVYASNQLRQVAEKQTAHPAISSVMRNRRLQFLPVLWRASLDLSTDDERERREREDKGYKNSFTLEDITLNNKIPLIRDVMNNVLIDVPYFMSHHREKMIETVCAESNWIYQLWCARNPGFDRRGRVHLAAHSLGSALAANILSKQPTISPPLSTLSDDEIKAVTGHFLFNTSCLFMLGSPLGIFMHLHQSQLIARKGRERTLASPSDEALDTNGVFGCLAVDSIYNVFNNSDPIAYRLNPCVDAALGRTLKPSVIPNLVGSLTGTITNRVSRLWGSTFPSSTPRESNPNSRPSRSANRQESELELGTSNERFEGTQAERRFMALNHHGTVDFSLPSDGNISEYLDMLTAHSSYWGDPNFAAFLLTEVCARREDMLRTGIAPMTLQQ